MTATPAALPTKVRQVLEARLAQLSAPALSTVELAAVIGRAFTFSVLAAASDLSEDILVGCLDECWRKRIIREQEDASYDFSHDKLREAAYAGLSRTRLRWLHGQAAQAIERVHAADLDRVAGVIAAHYEAARRPGQAIAYYDRAAAVARRVYAHGEALVALERAVSLLDALPDPTARCGLAAHLQEELGDLQELMAQHGPAQDAYAAALACAPDTDRIAGARLRRKIGKTLESQRAAYAQVAAQYAMAEALLGAPARNDADAAWWAEWCQIQIEHLILLYWWRRPGEMAERIARVRPLIESRGTPAQRAALFGNLNRHLNQSNRFAPSDTALEYARAALEALPPPASPELRAPYQFALGFNLLWHGDLAEAEAELHTALEMAELVSDLSLQARCLAYLAVVHRRQGYDAEVETYARRELAVAESAGMLDYLGAGRANLAWLAARRGDLVEAERLGQAALASWRTYAMPYPFYWQALWPLIGVALAQDRPADAIPHVRQLCDPSQQLLPAAIEKTLVAALAAWDAGQLDAARNLLYRALDIAQQVNFS